MFHELEYSRDVTFVDDAALGEHADEADKPCRDGRDGSAILFVHSVSPWWCCSPTVDRTGAGRKPAPQGFARMSAALTKGSSIMACHPEQPFTAAQEERIRQMIVDGINEATRQRNREAGERMRREVEEMRRAKSLG
ncbi:hypothetical protein ASF14_11105 [Sphingomonas sp. Leaf257]|nr:hypothetical protein ASF14_11105 [Sphingomonas sp. Leaf257]